MNLQETELIQICKSHFRSMCTRLLGIKSLIRILIAKDCELEDLKRKYKAMEAKHSEEVQKFISERITHLSMYDNNQPETCRSLPLPNSYDRAKQAFVSEETYYDLLKQLCHAKSVLSTIQDESNKPLKIESWTQTEVMSPPRAPTDTLNELTQNNQALQKRIEKQQSELESLKEENADLSKQLEQVQSAKRTAVEKEKKSVAKLKRELELHEKSKREIQKLKQDLKAKEIPKRTFYTTCASEVSTDFLQDQMDILEVDCCEEDTQPPKQCMWCQQYFSSDEEFKYHNNNSICQKLKKS